MKYNVDDNQSSIKTHFIVLPQKRGQVGNENTGNNCFDHLEHSAPAPRGLFKFIQDIITYLPKQTFSITIKLYCLIRTDYRIKISHSFFGCRVARLSKESQSKIMDSQYYQMNKDDVDSCTISNRKHFSCRSNME